MRTLTYEIARRRTFTIISHLDAGKATLTEKLLLFGGRCSWRAKSRHAASGSGCARIGWRSTRAQPLGLFGGDELGTRGARLQPSRQTGPPGVQRARLPHADRGRQRGNCTGRRPNGTKGASRSRPVSSSRSAGYAACQHSSTNRAETRFDLLDTASQSCCRCKPRSLPARAGATGEM